MAKVGFYDIRTFECLAREVQNEKFYYDTIYKKSENEAPAEHDGAGDQTGQATRVYPGGKDGKQFKGKKKADSKKKPTTTTDCMFPVSAQ